MNNNYLQPIYNENDLLIYEKFINSPNYQTNENFDCFLKNHIGKNLKIYISVGNQLTTRQGKLLAVYSDYLTLAQPRDKLVVKLCEIKFITVM